MPDLPQVFFLKALRCHSRRWHAPSRSRIMINQILPLGVRNSSSRNRNIVVVSSSGSAPIPKSTTATGSLNPPRMHRNPKFRGEARPEPKDDGKQYWLAMASTPTLAARFAENDVKPEKESLPGKLDQERPVDLNAKSEGCQRTEGTKTPQTSSSTPIKVPFDLLNGTFWNSSCADASDGENPRKSDSLTDAVKEKTTARLAQLRYWSLVIAFGGACWLLALLLLTMLTAAEKQFHGLSSTSIVAADTQDHSRQASNR